MPSPTRVLAAALSASCGLACHAQLRVCAWNMSSYGGVDGREASFKTSLFASYQGRTLNPDIIIFQEVTTLAGANAIRAFLRDTAAGGSTQWEIAPFTDGPDTDMVFAYKKDTFGGKLTYVNKTLVAPGGNSSGAPRDIWRWDVRLAGYTSAGATLAVYGDHMKAGSTTTDQNRRLAECQLIRANANSLPAGWQFVIGGDFNMQASTQAAWVELTGSQANNRGRFFDPILTPGDWNNEFAFRFVHTQAPGGDPGNTGGMDDRLDFILIGGDLRNGQGFEYIGSLTLPYSTTTWNDPNHSFRCWGNDGTFYNLSINIAGNAMVGPTIAAALSGTTSTDIFGGHLPVFLDLRVPPLVGAPPVIDFGTVAQNAVAQQTLTVANAGDTARWTVAGIANLTYTLAPSAGLSAPAGNHTATPGSPGNNHTITLNTGAPGPFARSITINSNDPDHPSVIVDVIGQIIPPPPCYPNCDLSATAPILNVQDFACFLNAFASGDSYANCDQSTVEPALNVLDFACFLNAFAQGCT